MTSFAAGGRFLVLGPLAVTAAAALKLGVVVVAVLAAAALFTLSSKAVTLDSLSFCCIAFGALLLWV